MLSTRTSTLLFVAAAWGVAASVGATTSSNSGSGSSIDEVAVPIDDSSSGFVGDDAVSFNFSRAEISQLDTVSGIPIWVDPDTPEDKQSYVTSRGETWELVMSDEFSNPARNFTPGGDHLWTSLEKPDGVNGAVEFYSHNMTYVKCEPLTDASQATSNNATQLCYLTIQVNNTFSQIRVYNQYSRPPGYMTANFTYRAGMLQSWNKFCFQGGMVEVRAQLPGAVTNKSKNPDINKGPNARAISGAFYPTWPGIWLLGNLGRAIFSGSTQRMWPFSYNECNPKAFDPNNQRINACDPNPGHGLNPNQGRGAPEIDLLEGGGVAISSSIQIGPGLKPHSRKMNVNVSIPNEYKFCIYNGDCQTPGGNLPNVPTSLYAKRGHQTWYKGLRYTANGFCAPSVNDTQTYAEISASVKNITANKCTLRICPASNDVLADLSFIDGNSKNKRWGINSLGTCAAVMNNYQGSFLCDPDNTNKMCETPRNATTAKINTMAPFAYQMDALSANWGIHVGAYTGFVTYQVEWVMGDNGYLRWMLFGNPIFEIPAQSVVNGPQNPDDPNPRLTFPEEPMYAIFNVALSSQWGAMPPNVGKECRGDGKDEQTNRICDSFPMYMKIDYIRVYQDKSPNSTMAVGCDPKTHPTRQWIYDHMSEYSDDDNLIVEVDGGAPCRSDLDCMAPWNKTINFATGTCVEGRCACTYRTWGGPRCTTAMSLLDVATVKAKARSFGPPLYLSITVGTISLVCTCIIMVFCTIRRRQKEAVRQQRLAKMKSEMIEKGALLPGDFDEIELSRHSNATPQSKSKYQPLPSKAA